MTRRPRQCDARYVRRGSGYVLVLGACMLVSVIGLSSLLVVRVQQRNQDAMIDAARARLYARSGIEAAVTYTLLDPDWRTNVHTWLSTVDVDQGRCAVAVTDEDAETLDPAADEPVEIRSTGTVGDAADPDARQTLSVSARHPALELLACPLHAGGMVMIDGEWLELDGGPLSSNSSIFNTYVVKGDVEAKQVYNSGWIDGSISVDAPAKTMPKTDAFEYYRNKSTTVVLPASDVGGNLEWVLLSRNSNPWQSGQVSADGLYYIKPGGDLHVRDCRIVGTLLVDLPAGKKLILEHGVVWEPARSDYPSLIVRGGECEIRLETYTEENGKVNFNPVGTPYNGSVDSDKFDVYRSKLNGLFHVTGSIHTVLIDRDTSIVGCVVVDGSVTIKGHIGLYADPDLSLTPPSRYRESWLSIDSGSWKPVVAAD